MFTSVATTHFTLQVFLLINPDTFLRKAVKGTYTCGIWITLVAIKGLAIGMAYLLSLVCPPK